MKKLIAVVLAVVSINVSAASGSSADDPASGNFWFGKCNSQGQLGKNQCISYILGIARGAEVQANITKTKPYFCIPPQVTYAQLGDVFAKYLMDHPESRHKEAPNLAMLMLVSTYPFPCD